MGKIKVSDMIKSSTKVSTDGKVTGPINYLSGDDVPKEGHYFPVEIDKKYYGKSLHAGGAVIDGEFVAGDDFTPSESDPYLNIRVESCTDGNKISVFDGDTKDELFKIDFNSATLEPPVGEYAVVIPETNRDFGGYGKASDFYDTKPTIAWSGVNGKVSGTFKWFAGNEQKLTTAGNYYPLVMNDFYKDKDVTVNGKTAHEWEWIVKLTKGKPVTVKYGKKTIAVLDFSDATLAQETKIKTASKTRVMSAPEAQEDGLSVADDEITYEQENGVEKRYTKSEINRMSTADLQSLAIEKGIDGAYDMTGAELKTLLIDMLVN